MEKRFFYSILGILTFAFGFMALADAPTPPSGITATSTTPTSVNLSWASSTGAISYQIFRNSTSTPIATTTSLSYINTNLTPNTLYNYYLTSVDASSTVSALSSSTPVTTLSDTTKPSTPLNLVALPASLTQINLSWSTSTDDVGVVGYKIYVNGSGVNKATSTINSYQDIGLTASTTYSYQVSAIDAAGNESGLSATATASTINDTTKPSMPTSLVATPISSTQINLSWTASTDNIGVAGYKIYVNGNTANKATTTTNSYQDIGLTASTTYSYQVSAIDAAGNESDLSATATATTLAAGTIATGTPTIRILNGGKNGITQINVRSNQIVMVMVQGNSGFNVRSIDNNTVMLGGAKQIGHMGAFGWFMNRGRRFNSVTYSFRASDMADLNASSTSILFTATTKNSQIISASFPVIVKSADRFWKHWRKPMPRSENESENSHNKQGKNQENINNQTNNNWGNFRNHLGLSATSTTPDTSATTTEHSINRPTSTSQFMGGIRNGRGRNGSSTINNFSGNSGHKGFGRRGR